MKASDAILKGIGIICVILFAGPWILLGFEKLFAWLSNIVWIAGIRTFMVTNKVAFFICGGFLIAWCIFCLVRSKSNSDT